MVEAAAPRQDPSRRRRHSSSSSSVALSPSSGSNTNTNTNANAGAAAAARRANNPKPNLKTVASRYLLTPFSSSTKPATTSSSSAAPTATNSRRSASLAPRRLAGAAERSRLVVVLNNAATADAAVPVSAGSGCTATRTFSVAFQSPVYSLETGKARPVVSLSPAAAAPVTPEKRRSPKNAGAEARRGRVSDVRCPAAANTAPYGFGSGAVARSVEYCSPDKKVAAASILAAVRPTAPFDETTPRRASVDGAEYLRQALSSDTDSASSAGSQNNAGAGAATASGARLSPRSIMSSSARFAVGSRSDRFVGQTTPFPPRTSGVASPSPRTAPVKKKKSLLNTFLISSPFSRSSPIIKQPASSPRTVAVVAVAGKLQGKGSSTHCKCNPDSDMRRKAPADHKAEEEHQLRTLHSRHLQWRRANARADAALSAQTLAAEKHLHGAWAAILGTRRSVSLRKIRLQLLQNDWKLMATLRGHMIYLEEWSLLEKEHKNSLAGTVGALNATVLRLPVSDGAAADIQGIKNAVGSAVGAMQTIGNSTSNLMSKLDQANASVSQLCRVAIQERALMVQCRELLSTLASMHVKYCSLQGQRVQLQMTKRRLSC